MDLSLIAASDPEVKHYITMYTRRGRNETSAMLQRALQLFPVFEQHLSGAQLPLALKYLPVVESSLRSEVTSPLGAAGLWQFMPATARHYGLQVDDDYDERRALHASTRAACAFLSDLYSNFEDWYLVLAAYNCGPGRVRRAMRRAQSDAFLDLRQYLPRQTQQYISKFIAAAYVANFFDLHQIEIPVQPPLAPLACIPLSQKIELLELATMLKQKPATIRKYNPTFTADHVPYNQEEQAYVLHIPAAWVDRFESAWKQREAAQIAARRQQTNRIRDLLAQASTKPQKTKAPGKSLPLPASPKEEGRGDQFALPSRMILQMH